MPDNQAVVSIGLMREVFTSEFTPQLFGGADTHVGGADTHEAALRLVAQLVRRTQDDEAIYAIVRGGAPRSLFRRHARRAAAHNRGREEEGFDKTAPKRAEFEMTESGLVFFKLTGKSVSAIGVSDPFEILGLVRDSKSGSWARLLRLRDADGNEHEFIASDKQLLSDHDVVCGDMAEQGLRISKGQQGNLARYILDSKTDVRVALVNRIGWHKIGERDVFVLPSQVIGDPPGRVIYEANDKRHEDYSVRGTLSDWRDAVSIPAGQHPLPTLAISASLAGPLLHFAGLESGEIHLFGNSSTGKTTLLKLAASVWGNGGLVHSWRATSRKSTPAARGRGSRTLPTDRNPRIDGPASWRPPRRGAAAERVEHQFARVANRG